jgi:hypothetical protein
MNCQTTKPAFFQICIRILEAKNLAWPRMDPFVCVQVDKQKQYTAVKENTDRPYYNEVKGQFTATSQLI